MRSDVLTCVYYPDPRLLQVGVILPLGQPVPDVQAQLAQVTGLPASSITTNVTSNFVTTVYTLNATQVRRGLGRGWGRNGVWWGVGG